MSGTAMLPALAPFTDRSFSWLCFMPSILFSTVQGLSWITGQTWFKDKFKLPEPTTPLPPRTRYSNGPNFRKRRARQLKKSCKATKWNSCKSKSFPHTKECVPPLKHLRSNYAANPKFNNIGRHKRTSLPSQQFSRLTLSKMDQDLHRPSPSDVKQVNSGESTDS